jgi:hypothetical protein
VYLHITSGAELVGFQEGNNARLADWSKKTELMLVIYCMTFYEKKMHFYVSL